MKCNLMSTKEFDERQLQLRNKFGFQSFFLMSGLVMLFGILLDFGVTFESPARAAIMIILTAFSYFNYRCILAGAMTESQMNANIIFFPVFTGIWFILLLLHLINRDSFFEILYSLSMLLSFGITSGAFFWVKHKEKHAGHDM